jgi:glycerate kinase
VHPEEEVGGFFEKRESVGVPTVDCFEEEKVPDFPSNPVTQLKISGEGCPGEKVHGRKPSMSGGKVFMRRSPMGLKTLVAPNAFKGCLSAASAAGAMAKGVERADGEPIVLPLADGGDGTLAVLQQPLGLKARKTKALDPLGRPRFVRWGFNPKTRWAVIEMAQASGLALLNSDERRPLATTSFGTGQVIRAAIRAGAKVVLVGLGGSATVDGGLGILQALGARVVVRRAGQERTLNHPATGNDLFALHKIDVQLMAKTLKGVRIRVLCDVTNPLTGVRGAAPAFGPQKGATPSDVRRLAQGLKKLARLIRLQGGDIDSLPGAGAAGGAAAGLWGFAHASVERGVETIFRLIALEKHVKQSDLVLTGEGRVDRTSWEGKALGELVKLCRRHKKPIVVLAGGIGPGGNKPGLQIIPIGPEKMREAEKMRRAGSLIEIDTVNIVRTFSQKRRKRVSIREGNRSG